MVDILGYFVQENTKGEPSLLQRNMLLPFNGLPRSEDEELDHKMQQKEQIPTPEMIGQTYSNKSSDS